MFVLKSFTKTFCIPGLRLGYGLGSKKYVAKIMKIKPPWNVNCFVEDVAIAALEDKLYLKRTEKVLAEERKYLIKNLSKIPGLKVQASDANFFLLNIQETGYTAKTLRLKLLEDNVLVRDCTDFDGLNEYYLRISIKTRAENRILIRRLLEAVGG